MSSGLRRALTAVPAFLLFAVVALAAAGTRDFGGVVLLGIGAVVAGYLVGSAWALLIAVPFAVGGLASIDHNVGEIEGFGVIILLVMALPVALCAGVGVLVRTLTQR